MSAVQEQEFTAAWRRCTGLRRIDIGLLGYGSVGQAVAALARRERDRLEALGLDVRVRAALARDPQKARARQDADVVFDSAAFFRRRFDVVIDVIGGVDPAFGLVRRALEAGVPVVSANKTLLAARGEELAAISRRCGAPLAFDAAVVAGVPFIGALVRRPLQSSARRLTGIINGTSHFLVSALAAGASFDNALAEARALGYAEADAHADISGRDAAEKLTILLRLAGASGITPSTITTIGIDALDSRDFNAARDLGAVIKPIALASFEEGGAGAYVGPALVDCAHAAARTSGVFNFVEVAGASTLPVTFSGPGAGPEVTAATILDDVIEVVTSGVPEPIRLPRPVASADLATPPSGRWYIRVQAEGVRVDEVAELCVAHGVAAERLVQRDDVIAARTVPAPWSRAGALVEVFRAIGAAALVLPVIDGGAA